MITPNIGMMVLVSIPFGIHLDHLFFFNSIVIIDVPIEMHMALAMVDIHIGMYFTYGYCLHYH